MFYESNIFSVLVIPSLKFLVYIFYNIQAFSIQSNFVHSYYIDVVGRLRIVVYDNEHTLNPLHGCNNVYLEFCQ